MTPDMRGTPSSTFESCFKLLESFEIVFSRVLTCFDRVREAGPALFGRTIVICSRMNSPANSPTHQIHSRT